MNLKRTVATALAATVATAATASSPAPRRLGRTSGTELHHGALPAQSMMYRLGARDLLHVNIFTREDSDEDNAPIEVPVNTAGRINLPLIGRVQAAGSTADELEAEITRRLSKFVKDPQVSVHVREYRARKVFVVGQVNLNGPVYLEHENTTLFEVISRAGGFVTAMVNPLEGADPHNVVVERGGKKIQIDFYGDATSLEEALNFLVRDGDQIFVPKPLNRVRVLGGVRNATELELKPGMTLLDAIAKAGSFTERSRRDQVRIIRAGGGRENTTYVDATKIFHGRNPDIPLQSGDVIYVSEW